MPDKTRNLTVADALRDAAHKLQPKKITCAADKSLGRLEAEILLAYALKKDRVWLLTHPSFELRAPSFAIFDKLVRRRTTREPVAYILGQKEFYGRRFVVTKDVLIPRPDTELVVELATLLKPTAIWDVGTGSGAIAVTLTKEIPGAKILATDIDARALSVAKKNARLLGAKNVTFLKSDLLQPSPFRWLVQQSNASHLIITANLPYLPASDAKKIDADVAKFEPKRALYSGKDGLDLITRFLGQLARHLPEWNYASSTILIEFDPPQAWKLRALTKKLFPKAAATIHKDLAGRNRVLQITSR